MIASEQPDVTEDRNHGKPAIVAELSTDIVTLTAGEAAMRLDLADQQAMMFRNSAHGGLNVVYRRADGAIGWIDPGQRCRRSARATVLRADCPPDYSEKA